ncbi:phage virion morphogenesis protein [Pseudomonas aeruginosa]|uniref:phage virion morphogenesis protein n=1 Tax=Pseudomonas aeruginosa TaxID=287 RepID=UPI002E2928FD|nr:phage virion morphogenesis protein [Pseudomonas aeruginosa]HCG1236127.1 phage virion morphogenesis protein [Pseudomonas aeruginosa]
MADSLESLEDWAGPILRALEPGPRAALARSLARDLRRSQQKRVMAQRNPDGSAYEPRKKRVLRGKQGRIRRKIKMFQKLRTVRYLRAKGDAQAITVSFAGRIARIARVHQYGLRDRAEPGAPEVSYAQRLLLGFDSSDMETIQNGILAHIDANSPI